MRLLETRGRKNGVDLSNIALEIKINQQEKEMTRMLLAGLVLLFGSVAFGQDDP
jgi:hypothetical protein